MLIPFLSSRTGFDRSQIRRMIFMGQVKVNGLTVDELDHEIEEDDVITFGKGEVRVPALVQ